MRSRNVFTPVINKRLSFEHEKEFRLVVRDAGALLPRDSHGMLTDIMFPEGTHSVRRIFPEDPTKPIQIVAEDQHGKTVMTYGLPPIRPNVQIPCDVNALIEKVYVSPLEGAPAFQTVG